MQAVYAASVNASDPLAALEVGDVPPMELPAGWALQDPQDYLEAMVDTIQNVVVKSKVLPEEVVGIGVDFTSATVLPVYEDGTALCMTEKFRSEPHAFVKLWKHHDEGHYRWDIHRYH